MGLEFAALLGTLGLGSIFGLVGVLLAGWMVWRIAAKAGFPGWLGLGTVLLTLTGIGSVVTVVMLWVFAFMRWPRDDAYRNISYAPGQWSPAPPPLAGGPREALSPPREALSPPHESLPPPQRALTRFRGWRLSGRMASGPIELAFDGTELSYLVTGAPVRYRAELSVPDPSVGQPHARLYCVDGRLGLEDLGSSGGTYINGQRLLPQHGPRDITNMRSIRLGQVQLELARA